MSNAVSTKRYENVQVVALGFGLLYLVVAVAGWALTGASGESTLVIFNVNPLHNVIHTVIALGAIGGALSPRTAGPALLVLGAVLGLVTVAGFLGWLDMLAMHHGIGDPDNFLHLVTGSFALVCGLLLAPEPASGQG